MYPIKIKRRFFFGWKTFWVKRHFLEFMLFSEDDGGNQISAPIQAWLVLETVAGPLEIIPNIEKRRWRVYPDDNPELKEEQHGRRLLAEPVGGSGPLVGGQADAVSAGGNPASGQPD